ncbi:MAG: autotransporter outer membrane beta-barrel domain-containing protein [Puniceicoccales bacterium]|jgi:hypothetical protein|nr:autotransporter outer membrane beta-barrel domain-containing protein [Puniceicoccales bacterium]
MDLRRVFLGCLCIGVSSISALARDGIWEIRDTFESANPFTVQRNTDPQEDGIRSVIIDGGDGGGAVFNVSADAESPALTLENGVTIDLHTGGQFVVGNTVGGAIVAPSTSGYNNTINLQNGNFDISAAGTAIAGAGNLQLNIGTGGSIAGATAIRDLHTFSIANDASSQLKVTGLLDLSSAAQAGSGGVAFSNGAVIRLIPLETEQSTGTFGEGYIDNGNTYIKLGDGTNVDYGDLLSIALDVKNFYPNESVPGIAQRIKLVEWDNIAALQNVLQLTVENDGSIFPGWRLNYENDLNTVYARFSPGLITLIGASSVVGEYYGQADEATNRYVFIQPGSSLTISATGAIESAGELPISIDTSIDWESSDISIIINQADRAAIDNTSGVAIGQGTENGSSPFPDSGNNFFSPNVHITGTGTIRGSTGSFRMCATEVTPNVDFTDARMVNIGGLTIGNGADFVHMDGAVEMRLFDKDFGTGNVQLDGGIYIINPFALANGSSISGHVLLDASVKTGGIFSGLDSCMLVSELSANGLIEGKASDTYGICVALNPWVDDGQIIPQAGAIYVGGSIAANGECLGNYVGLLIDAPSSRASISDVIISGNIDATAGNESADCVRIGAVVHGSSVAAGSGFAVAGTVCGKNAALIFDGSAASIFNVPILIDNATLQTAGVAIGGRNANLHFASSSTLNSASMAQFAIAPCAPVYAYNNGATDVTTLETFSYEIDPSGKFSSVNADNLALLRNSHLTFQLDNEASFLAPGMNIAVTELAIGGSNNVTCQTLFLGGRAEFGGGSNLHVSDGIIFCPGASLDATRAASKFSIDQADVALGTVPMEGTFTGVPNIDASFAAVGDDDNPYGARIDISTASVAAILPDGIRGNLPNSGGFDTNTADRYVTVALGGAGGSIGVEGMEASGISNVGKLLINGDSNDSIWTIHGNTSCGTLRIEKGKMVQRGNLSVRGDLLLLGCDIDWSGDASFNHVYAGEDKITVHTGSNVKISNGFSADAIGTEFIPFDSDIQLKMEAILLGGNSQFILEPGASLNLGIAGCDVDKYGTDAEPVAIRVVGSSLKLGETSRQQPDDGQAIGNGNVIDLQGSPAITYYRNGQNFATITDPLANSDMAAIGPGLAPGEHIYPEKNVTAIRGNATTHLFLNGGVGALREGLHGAISNVGHVHVNGDWHVPEGLHECGHLTLMGKLNCENANVDAWRITFAFCDERLPSCLLYCNKINTTYGNDDIPVCFDFEFPSRVLEGSDAFEVELVRELTSQPNWVCATKVDGKEPEIRYVDGIITVGIPSRMGSSEPRKVEFSLPEGIVAQRLQYLSAGKMSMPYSIQQALVVRRQNDHFRRAMELADGNFSTEDGYKWHLTRESYGSFSSRSEVDAIIDRSVARTTGSNISLRRRFPTNQSVVIAADYVTSHARFRRRNTDEPCRCRIKGYGAGAGWQMATGPWRISGSGILSGNRLHYGKYSEHVQNISFGGYSYVLSGGLEYAMPRMGAWTFSPLVEGNFNGIFHDAYAMDGGSVNIGSCCTEIFQAVCGFRAQLRRERAQILADFALRHDFRRNGGSPAATTAGGGREVMPSYFPERNSAGGKLQATVPWRKAWEFSLNYDFTCQKHFLDHTVTLGSIYNF